MQRLYDFQKQVDIGEKAEQAVIAYLRELGMSFEDVRGHPEWRIAGVDFRVSTPLGTISIDVKADTRTFNNRLMLETVSVAVPAGDLPSVAPEATRPGNLFTTLAHKFVYAYACGTLVSVDALLARRWLTSQGRVPCFRPDGRLEPMRPSTPESFMSRVLNRTREGLYYEAEVCIVLRPLEPKTGETTAFAEIVLRGDE